jgi:hypothetical protein
MICPTRVCGMRNSKVFKGNIMRLSATTLLLCLVIATLTFSGSRVALGEDTVTTPPIDITKPDSWEAVINHARNNLSNLAKILISVAEDKERSNEERRKAIFILGKVGNKESIDFLITYISLRLPMERIKGDEDMLKETPSKYALSEFSVGNWNVAVAILAALDTPRPQTDLMNYAFFLKRILGGKSALMLTTHELENNPETTRRKNLEAIKDLLQS